MRDIAFRALEQEDLVEFVQVIRDLQAKIRTLEEQTTRQGASCYQHFQVLGKYTAQPVVKFRFDSTIWPEGCAPTYANPGDAGADIKSSEDWILESGTWHPFKTGLFLEVQDGFECQIRPRSGLAMKHGISIVNSPGTVDSSYTGEILILLENRGKWSFEVKKGERIAQMVITRVSRAQFVHADSLSESQRGDKGFGSSGT